MSRHTIEDSSGNKHFWSDSDGDSGKSQTLYDSSHKIGVGSTEVGKVDTDSGKITFDNGKTDSVKKW